MSRLPETWVVLKGGKYLTGHSYATGIGDRYSWSKEPSAAWKMTASLAFSMARHTRGNAQTLRRRPQ